MKLTFSRLGEGVKFGLLLAFAMLLLIPFVWMVATSFKTSSHVFTNPMFWPRPFSLEGYIQVFQNVPLLAWLRNSIIIAGSQTVGQMLNGILAAFAFAHFRFPGRDALFFFVLITMMIPEQVTMLPIYLVVNHLHWLDRFEGVVVPHLASGYAIFLLRQTFLTVPKELDEASIMDGCGPLGSMWHVYLKLSGPVLSALAIILLVGNWNEFQWPLLVLSDKTLMPLPLAFVQFRQEESLEWVPSMAIAVLSMLPVILTFLFVQKQFIEGFANSGLKG